ncbi:MAG: helix-turn-helix domain-containing protein [Bacilli bacterium]|nr:helix-turn-helix domain-containing protein [Bacilli bacterium]
MSLLDVRNQNIEKVTKEALKMFVSKGIENSKVSDIAKNCDLAERSLFRYFPTKADLVLAAAKLFWHEMVKNSYNVLTQIDNSLDGIDQLSIVVKTYAHQFFDNKEKLIFVQESEVYLYRYNKGILNPVDLLNNQDAPMYQVIQKGVKDGSIKNQNIEELYLIVYDSLLGFMQKMATGIYAKSLSKAEQLQYLNLFCEMLVNSFRK